MYLIGDIGNTETKIFIIDNKSKIIDQKIIKTNLITFKYLSKKFKNLTIYKDKIKKILFCSVVPKTFKIVRRFIEKKN